MPKKPKDPKIFLGHIIDSINAVGKYTKDISREEFYSNRQIIDAVVRNMEIIGEAAKNLPKNLRVNTPHIPWKMMTGMRDNLIHEYFGVDKEEVWKTIKEDLPPLKKEIERLLK